MGNRIIIDEICQQLRCIYRVALRNLQNEVQNESPFLSVTDNSRVSLVTSAKRPPMVSYASNLFTEHKMLYCIIVKVRLAI